MIRPGFSISFGLLLLTAVIRGGNQLQGAARVPSFGAVTRRATIEHDELPTQGPECTMNVGVFCLQDTAYVHKAAGDGNIDAWGTILWFGRAGDSLVMSAHASAVQTSIGDDKDALHNNVPWFHRRVPRDGTITIWTTMEEERGDSVRYTLRVQDMTVSGASPALEPTGQTARLVLTARNPRVTTEFSVIPASQLRPGVDRTAWKTVPGRHKVALTRDSLYEVCVLPCTAPKTIKLLPNQVVLWRY